ncbi:unnamed protein product, partial [Rotaria sordida]
TWRLCDVITGDETWFYHTQIGRKSSTAAWMERGDPPPTSDSPVFIHPVEWEQAIDHYYYINNCLRPLVEQVKRGRPSYGTRAIKIDHDNGRSHIHKDVSDYLESKGVTIIPHPPNSPDLSPCDLWLFDLIKENLTDESDLESLCDAVSDFMYSLNKEEYKKPSRNGFKECNRV